HDALPILTYTEYHQFIEKLGRQPNMVELGMAGAMWSEHCGYKHSKPLLRRFPTSGPRVLQGPGENAGVVDLGDGWAAALKIESHNHPSAVEPVDGAATGVGGIIRTDKIMRAVASGVGKPVLPVGAETGRDGIRGATFAADTVGQDALEDRPAVQVGNPFHEKCLMEACLEVHVLGIVVGMQDL